MGEDGSQILSIHLSDKMSSSYNNAKTAASKSTTDVTVLNSQVTAAGLAYQVLKAAKMIKEGKIIKDILPELAKVRDNTRIFFLSPQQPANRQQPDYHQAAGFPWQACKYSLHVGFQR